MKQIYELGQKVWAFKQQGKDMLKVCGVVQSAEIDASGFVFYKIATILDGEIKFVMANHASIADSESGIDSKIKLYFEFQEQQKQLFEERIGKPEFEPEYIANALN